MQKIYLLTNRNKIGTAIAGVMANQVFTNSAIVFFCYQKNI